MTQIATYREHIPGILRRTFTLYPEQVIVNSTFSLGNKSEVPVTLADLRPQYAKSWLRTRHFRLAIFALVMCSPVIIVPFFSSPTPKLQILFFSVYAIAIFYLLASLRRIEFASFRNHSGVILLDIGRVGPDSNQYEEFVSLLVQRIQSSQNAAQLEDSRNGPSGTSSP
jgi:hypothetical protein